MLQDLLHKIVTAVIASLMIIASNLTGQSRVASPTPTPTSIVEISPLASTSPTPTSNPKVKNIIVNVPTTTPIINATQKPKVDPAVGIEQCKTYATEKRKTEEAKVNEQYAQSEPAIVELAAAQNNSQTETTALKYGKMNQSQVVSRAGVFEKLLSQGVPMDQASLEADREGSAYSTYLRAVHDWAVGELNKWNTAAKNELDSYGNQVYQSCLSSL